MSSTNSHPERALRSAMTSSSASISTTLVGTPSIGTNPMRDALTIWSRPASPGQVGNLGSNGRQNVALDIAPHHAEPLPELGVQPRDERPEAR